VRRATKLLLIVALAAVLVPLVPFLLFGARLDRIVAGWLEPPPPAPVLAALVTGVLAADLLLPVPSSVVATFGGAKLGVALGSLCAFAGMTIGAVVGWWLGRRAGSRALDALDDADRGSLERGGARLGPLLVLLTRPLPLLAEAAVLAAGGAGMPFPTFLAAAAAGNAVIALAWSALGAAGRDGDALSVAMLVALLVPVAVAFAAARAWRGRDAATDD